MVAKLLHYFKRKLGIPIHLFWNADQLGDQSCKGYNGLSRRRALTLLDRC